MRKLASIKKINDIIPIEGKDLIALAVVDGWQVIIQKAEFSVDDLCVFCEIDSVLPEKPEFEFLRKRSNFRIKTMKMAGVISQGICFPLSILPTRRVPYSLEEDVTEIIGVTKYEKYSNSGDMQPGCKKDKLPKFLKPLMRYSWFRKYVKHLTNSKERRGFPSFVSRTDEPRIQNMPWLLSQDYRYFVTEKIDGQSATFAVKKRKHPIKFWVKDDYEFIVASRNLRIWKESDGSPFWRNAEKHNLKVLLTAYAKVFDLEWACIQGEQIGPSIQGNKYKVNDVDLYVFNFIDSFVGKHDYDYMKDKFQKWFPGIKLVPLLERDFKLPEDVNEILEYATDKSKLYDTLREGVVLRTSDAGDKEISCKAVSPKFLLKWDE